MKQNNVLTNHSENKWICMNTKSGLITQYHIRATLAKKKTGVLALLIFYKIRKNTKKYFKVLSFVIYTIIKHYACIDYLDFLYKKLLKYLLVLEGVINMETTNL